MTEEDAFTKKRALSTNAKKLADCAYAAAAAVQEMTASGASPGDILRAVWSRLAPREAGILDESIMVDVFSPLLGFLIPMMQDGPDSDRMSRAVSHLRFSMGGNPDFSGVVAGMEAAVNRVAVSSPARMKVTIQRLFKENPSPLPDQAPAIECGVMLVGIPVTLRGALSETPEGGLRLLSPSGSVAGRLQMVEQFFSYEDVLVIAMQREIAVDAPRIIQTS